MPTDSENQSTQSTQPHHSNTNAGNKNSKARFSMPTYPSNMTQHQHSEHVKLFPVQGNNYQNQQLNYNGHSNNMPPSPSENLFNLQEDYNQHRNDQNLRDIMNIPSQKDSHNTKNPSKHGNNNYQPNLYQNNNVPSATDQPKHPYNFSAQMNNQRKKGQSPNENADPQYRSGTGQKGTDESLQQINKRHEELINVILAEEEEVISLHRQHIDDMVDLVKQV